MLLYSHWLSLPIHIRYKIASDFGITKKGATHVVNNEIQSDGFLIKDVEQILNVDALQKHLGTTETDMALLWNELVYRAEHPEEVRMPVIQVESVKVEKPKKGRPKKK